MSDPEPTAGPLCRICHSPISHRGADCPHCRSRASLPTLPPYLMLFAAFVMMAVLFGVTSLLTREYRSQRSDRRSKEMHLAAAAVAAGRLEAAVAGFRDALEYDRQSVDARLGLARALLGLGRDTEARNHLVELRVVEPTNAAVSRLLGDIAQGQGRLEEAAGYYRAAIYGRWLKDAESSRLQTRFALIDLLAAQGDVLQEVSELAEILEERPDDTPTRQRVGRLLLQAGAPAKAVDVFDDIVEARPDDAAAWMDLGRAEFARAHYLSARTAFSRALPLDRDQVEVRRWLQLCNEIVDLDPTYRRAGTRERHRRSQVLVRRALAETELCVTPAVRRAEKSPHPNALSRLVEQAEEVLSRDVPAWKSEESVEQNVSLAERLWQERLRSCSTVPPADEALRHLLEKLGQ